MKNLSKVALAIIGAGPAGLMAAQAAADAGVRDIHVFDAMPSVGRKLLLAGIGGLNITHNELHTDLLQRYHPAAPALVATLNAFKAADLRIWCADLGIETFVGSNGRVFPINMKAAPLLRAWLARLKSQGVQFHSRHRWLGWTDLNELRFVNTQAQAISAETAENKTHVTDESHELLVSAQATVLALGGGSWQKLGSDGAWQALLAQRGVTVRPLKPANCGFNVMWSDFFKAKYSGVALKNIAIMDKNSGVSKLGELILTQYGIEGSLVYFHSAIWRDALDSKLEPTGYTIYLDLLPHHSLEKVLLACNYARGTRSWASHLASRLGLNGVAYTLLRECCSTAIWLQPIDLARAIKGLPIVLQSTRSLDEAISSAGGVAWEALDEALQLKALPNVFCAGEMLNWEAPTGGYLLTACWSTGRQAGLGAAACLADF